MPKSKREKVITLSKTKKRGSVRKEQLVQTIRECVDKYSDVYVFETKNMRNNQLKDVRTQWVGSRFVFGKNTLMILALGRSEEDEHKKNLHLLGQHIQGSSGLLFTDKSKEDVIKFIETYREKDYARSGFVPEETISVPEGPLPQFSHSLEPYLRKLGLPTELQNGIINLRKDHDICKSGEALTPEQARLLKLFEYKLSEFYFTLKARWSAEEYEDLS